MIRTTIYIVFALAILSSFGSSVGLDEDGDETYEHIIMREAEANLEPTSRLLGHLLSGLGIGRRGAPHGFGVFFRNPLLGIGSRFGPRFDPLGRAVSRIGLNLRKKLIHKAFDIYKQGLKIEKEVANFWFARLTGDHRKAVHTAKKIKHLMKHRETAIRSFELGFGVRYYSVPFFGQRRKINLYESLYTTFNRVRDFNRRLHSGRTVGGRLFGLSPFLFDTKKLFHEAKHIYVSKLKIDKQVGEVYRFLYVGDVKRAIHKAKHIRHKLVHLVKRLASFRAKFGIPLYQIPYFGHDLKVLEGKLAGKSRSTVTRGSARDDDDDDNYDDYDDDNYDDNYDDYDEEYYE